MILQTRDLTDYGSQYTPELLGCYDIEQPCVRRIEREFEVVQWQLENGWGYGTRTHAWTDRKSVV